MNEYSMYYGPGKGPSFYIKSNLSDGQRAYVPICSAIATYSYLESLSITHCPALTTHSIATRAVVGRWDCAVRAGQHTMAVAPSIDGIALR